MIEEADAVGQVFGRLTVLDLQRTAAGPACVCCCSCGALAWVRWHDLRRGTKSCGCLRAESLSARRLTHGATASTASSDERRTWSVWSCMKDRCRNPKNKRYHVYGARGITIDPAWDSFAQFLQDMGPCPKGYSIERAENNGDYTKDNCHWWPRAKQSMNRQDTIWIRYEGQDWCFKRLCEYLQQPYLKTYKRYVMRGWDLARALNLTEENKNDLARIE